VLRLVSILTPCCSSDRVLPTPHPHTSVCSLRILNLTSPSTYAPDCLSTCFSLASFLVLTLVRYSHPVAVEMTHRQLCISSCTFLRHSIPQPHLHLRMHLLLPFLRGSDDTLHQKPHTSSPRPLPQHLPSPTCILHCCSSESSSRSGTITSACTCAGGSGG